MASYFTKVWYNKSSFLILRPLSLLYSWLSQRRRKKLTAQAWLPPVPTIVVGNLSVGGTGKTPLVIYLAKLLRDHGFQPLIISRGYKGIYQGIKMVSETDSPNEVGDEVLLIKQETGVPVVISPNRVKAVQCILEEVPPRVSDTYADPRVIISDDGLQHYSLGRHIEIAVLDAGRQFGNQQLLPEGPLREKLTRLAEVDFIVANGSRARAAQHQQVAACADKLFSMRFIPNQFRSVSPSMQDLSTHTLSMQVLSIEAFKAKFGTQIKAVAAIGNPSRFFISLQNLGFRLDVYDFPDHHLFTRSELINILHNKDPHSPLMMTGKDAVKCRNFALENLWYMEIKVELEDEFNQKLLNKLA